MNKDKFFMKYALKLADKGKFTTSPNPNVGCVIVKDGKIVGEGWHQRTGGKHAEIYALDMAGNKSIGSTAYITLEPCSYFGKTPPCCNKLIKSKIKRVVIAVKDPNPKVSGNGIKKLKQHGINISYGIMINEAKKINFSYIKRIKTGFPWTQIKLGSSLDGHIAISNGKSKWITSVKSRKDAQYFRAQSSAILSSSSTILADNPRLTVRLNELSKKNKKKYFYNKIRHPIRIILDSKNRIQPYHKIIAQPGKNILVRLKKDDLKWPINTKQLVMPSLNNNIDLKFLFKKLAHKSINYIFVEAGATLAGSLLTLGLVDEIVIYLSTKLLGNNNIDLLNLPKISKIEEAPKLYLKYIKKIGQDLRLILIPNKLKKDK